MKPKEPLRILISNAALPSQKVGSWTNRITRLLESHPDFFDFILSPTEHPNNKFIFCEKGQLLNLPKRFKKYQLLSKVGGDFVDKIKKLASKASSLQILVMDDQILLEVMTNLKKELTNSIELVFSFHGHKLLLAPDVMQQVDKVLFLTKAGYMESLASNEVFTPLVYIVGNGVDSNLFFPLEISKKNEAKVNLGFPVDSKILIWMSNDRAKKGRALFTKISEKLQKLYPELYFIIIGAEDKLPEDTKQIKSLGKIPNHQLPSYLQIGDYYFFTSLWKEGFGLSLVEAAKCGNFVLASRNGGIPDVLKGFSNCKLIDSPNIINEWVDSFKEVYEGKQPVEASSKDFLDEFHSLEQWENDYLSALND